MKNIKIAALAALLFFAVACDKKLDIEPQQSISETLALDSDANVKLVLTGAYNLISQEGIYGGNLFRDAELAGADGEVRWVGTFGDPREIFNHEMVAGNFDVENTWSQAYDCINSCNNILSALAIVNEADRARVEGEARFLRAACYFEINRLYGLPYEPGASNDHLGVPLVTEPTRGITDASFVARASAEVVYKFCQDELHRAIDILPEANDVYANKYTAAALAARLHLTLGEYGEAEAMADFVINSGKYGLEPNFADLWNRDGDTGEAIFSMQVSDQDGDNELVTFFSIPDFGGRDGDIEIEQKHLDFYEVGDARAALFYDGNAATRTGKWRDQYKNIPVIRLAEMHLIRAECAIRDSRDGTADVNLIRARAGLPDLLDATLADVFHERRVELAFEGHRIHDIKRQQGMVDGLNWDDDKLVFPIPEREIEVNKKLVQNPGY